MKRILYLIISAALLLTVLTGCGENDDVSSDINSSVSNFMSSTESMIDSDDMLTSDDGSSTLSSR